MYSLGKKPTCQRGAVLEDDASSGRRLDGTAFLRRDVGHRQRVGGLPGVAAARGFLLDGRARTSSPMQISNLQQTATSRTLAGSGLGVVPECRGKMIPDEECGPQRISVRQGWAWICTDRGLRHLLAEAGRGVRALHAERVRRRRGVGAAAAVAAARLIRRAACQVLTHEGQVLRESAVSLHYAMESIIRHRHT